MVSNFNVNFIEKEYIISMLKHEMKKYIFCFFFRFRYENNIVIKFIHSHYFNLQIPQLVVEQSYSNKSDDAEDVQ